MGECNCGEDTCVCLDPFEGDEGNEWDEYIRDRQDDSGAFDPSPRNMQTLKALWPKGKKKELE